MITTTVENGAATKAAACVRSGRLADRLETQAKALMDFARGLSDDEWRKVLPGDGRTFGVIVHHVASIYPLEIQLAQAAAAGTAMVGVVWQNVHDINAAHARDNANVTKDAALQLLRENSAAAASAIRALSESDLDRAVPMSLYGDAELTCQFFLEDHAIRHSMHHLARLRTAR